MGEEPTLDKEVASALNLSVRKLAGVREDG